MYLSARLEFLAAAGTLHRAGDPERSESRRKENQKSAGETHRLFQGSEGAGSGEAEVATGPPDHRSPAELHPAGNRPGRSSSGCRPPGRPPRGAGGRWPPQGWSRWSPPLEEPKHTRASSVFQDEDIQRPHRRRRLRSASVIWDYFSPSQVGNWPVQPDFLQTR